LDNKEANILYHTALADVYDRDQPHMSEENSARVRGLLQDYAELYGNNALLDVGCGTGFILRLSKGIFKRIVGVDITPKMLDKARAINAVEVYEAASDKMPFSDGQFDVITAYGFLHHIEDLMPTLREIYRCLKKGGLFYADQDPNYYCWRALRNINGHSTVLSREIASVKVVASVMQEYYGIARDVTEMAEYHKFNGGFLQENALKRLLGDAGFKDVKVDYRWFLGQGGIKDKALAVMVEEQLKALLPISRPLFKYISIGAVK